jgi:hypothetical protein
MVLFLPSSKIFVRLGPFLKNNSSSVECLRSRHGKRFHEGTHDNIFREFLQCLILF